jgi:ADP-heptose:LPS heptosyltransferase
VLVANDSGPVHLATSVGTPVVAIFGPTNARAWRPYPPDDPRHQVVREQLACSPCIWRGHDFGTPQGCPARTCLAILEPSSVVAAAERALSIVPNAFGDMPHPPAPKGLRPLDPRRMGDIALA